MPQEQGQKRERKNVFLTVQAKVDGILRNEMMNDIDHLIVPMVILVEGVLTPAGAPFAELALAEEFAKHPQGWDGRPIVFGHPVRDGISVSANRPDVLEEEMFGQLFNTRLVGQKLKSEAWLNLNRVSEIGGGVQEAVDHFLAGELVEVSTGLFMVLEFVDGEHDGKAYSGIWRDVVPDHLAILPEGVQGACSVEDGCGGPRVNQNQDQDQVCQCGNSNCRGDCMANAQNAESESEGVETPATADSVVVDNANNADNVDAGNNDSTSTNDDDDVNNNSGNNDSQVGVFQNLMEKFRGIMSFRSNSEELSDTDTRIALQAALEGEDSHHFVWIIAVFSEEVVYEEGFSGTLKSRGFSISDDGTISLASETVQVRPVTEFVPVKTTQEESMTTNAERVEALIANEGTRFTEEHRPWLSTLEEEVLGALEPVEATSEDLSAADNTASDEGANQSQAEQAAAPIVEQASDPAQQNAGDVAANQAPAVPATPEAYLEAAPKEIRDVLSEGLNLQKARKDELINSLTTNERCKFTPEQLKVKDIDELENLAALANISVNYGARPVPRTNEDSEAIPPAPLVFPPKDANAA